MVVCPSDLVEGLVADGCVSTLCQLLSCGIIWGDTHIVHQVHLLVHSGIQVLKCKNILGWRIWFVGFVVLVLARYWRGTSLDVRLRGRLILDARHAVFWVYEPTMVCCPSLRVYLDADGENND